MRWALTAATALTLGVYAASLWWDASVSNWWITVGARYGAAYCILWDDPEPPMGPDLRRSSFGILRGFKWAGRAGVGDLVMVPLWAVAGPLAFLAMLRAVDHSPFHL